MLCSDSDKQAEKQATGRFVPLEGRARGLASVGRLWMRGGGKTGPVAFNQPLEQGAVCLRYQIFL